MSSAEFAFTGLGADLDHNEPSTPVDEEIELEPPRRDITDEERLRRDLNTTIRCAIDCFRGVTAASIRGRTTFQNNTWLRVQWGLGPLEEDVRKLARLPPATTEAPGARESFWMTSPEMSRRSYSSDDKLDHLKASLFIMQEAASTDEGWTWIRAHREDIAGYLGKVYGGMLVDRQEYGRPAHDHEGVPSEAATSTTRPDGDDMWSEVQSH